MRNHDQKAKDMAESVLPSTARRSAREDRRLVHGRARAAQRDQLRRIELAVSTDFEATGERARREGIAELVSGRRAADKTGSLVRWGRARVARDPALRRVSTDEQVRALAGLMPDNLIGRHAVDHIRWGLEIDRCRAERSADPWRNADAQSLAATAADVRRILEYGRHRALNEEIRALVRAEDAGPPPDPHSRRLPARTTLRLLAGLHDVEDFATVHHRRHVVREIIARLSA